MNKLKIFWKEQCPSCVPAKQLGKECECPGIKVEYYNVETSDGLAEGSFYNIMATPTIVITDINDNHLYSWASIVPSKKELVEKLR